MICSTDDLTHICVVISTIFTEQLQEGGIHHGFLIVQQAKHLDHAFRPAFEFKEFTDGILVIFSINMFPG